MRKGHESGLDIVIPRMADPRYGYHGGPKFTESARGKSDWWRKWRRHDRAALHGEALSVSLEADHLTPDEIADSEAEWRAAGVHSKGGGIISSGTEPPAQVGNWSGTIWPLT